MSFITLLYHEIREGSSFDPQHPSHIDVKQAYEDILPPVLFITLEKFEEQMAYLKEKHYSIITLHDVKNFYFKGIKLPEKAVLLTFDDCYQSIKKYAYPILKKYGFPATGFVVTGWLHDTPKDFNPAKSVTLTEGELKEISDVFEFANHTDLFHQRWDRSTSILMTSSDEDFEKDLNSCNKKDYVKHKDVFAYPFGLFEERNVKLLREKGFRLAFTSQPGLNLDTTDPFLLNRTVVPYPITMEEFIQLLPTD
jgi:peptidoglycan/xylan/chitin deacetylase (PgdA/CDA1 family)